MFHFRLRVHPLRQCITLGLKPQGFVLPSRAERLLSGGAAMGSAINAVMMRQRLNPLTGMSEWEVVTEEGEDPSGWRFDPQSSELARTSYLDMLNDRARNAAYAMAIEKAVQGANHVLDIGAGTGLLSMMALRSMKKQAVEQDFLNESTIEPRVTACESFLPMLRLARKVLRANDMSSGVRLVHKRSDEMKVGIDMPCRADVLISEILDSELLGEGLIPTLRHAHANLLTSGVRSVPFKATVYGQLIECDFLWRSHDLVGVEGEIADGLTLAGSELRRWLPIKCELQVNALCNMLQLLSDPFKLFEFEFSKIPSDYREIELEVPIIRAGIAHALVSWWVLQLDEEGSVKYSTAPQWINSKGRTSETEFSVWREHWKQCVWFLKGQSLDVTLGDVLTVRGDHDSISIRYSVQRQHRKECINEVANSAAPNSSGQHGMKPERVGMLGDKHLRSSVMAAVAKVVRGLSDANCLVLDDSLLMTAAAAFASPSTQVTAMLPGFRSYGLELVRDMMEANGFQADRVSVLAKKASSITSTDLAKKVDVLLAEPYYWNYEGMLPWRNLRFWSERTVLDPLLADNVSVMPCTAVLRGVAAYLPDLWHSRCSLGVVEGFDHSSVNQSLGACGDLSEPVEGPLLPYAVWQCGHVKELTEAFSLMSLDLTNKMQAVTSVVKIPFSKMGTCHAIVLWLDWVYDMDCEFVYSTGPAGNEPSYWKQGVKLLKTPVLVRSSAERGDVYSNVGAQYVTLSTVFDPTTGDVRVDADFL